MYAVTADPYCYTGTEVLKNKKGLRDAAQLEQFELAATMQRADEALPSGRLTPTHYRAIHRHLFQDVYTWAGRYRTVRISKNGSVFCYPENISGSMRNLFANLASANLLRDRDIGRFSQDAAHFLAELNAIHAFREGNGRTQLTFMSLLAHQAGWQFNLDHLNPEIFLAAMIESFSAREAALIDQIRLLIE